jgi:cytochrome P450
MSQAQDSLYETIFTIPSDSLPSSQMYPMLHRLRETGPVHEGRFCEHVGRPYRDLRFQEGIRYFSCYSWETCYEVFFDNETFSSEIYHVKDVFGRMLGGMVGQEHRRYRQFLHPYFTKNRANHWWAEKWIQPIVNRLIDSIVDRGHANLSLDVFAKLPVQAIMASFGVPPEEAIRYKAALERVIDITISEEERQDAKRAVADLLGPIISDRRRLPQDDLISLLVHGELATEEGETRQMTDEEIHSHAIQILTAGSGTTWRQSGITLYALLTHPDQYQALLGDRSLLRGAIEEALRWESAAPSFPRLVTRDVELAGQRIPAGAVIEVVLAAANRDPRRWPDADRFDITRKIETNMAFGYGPHICLGMHVARTELEIVVSSIMDRLPNLRLDPAEPLPVVAGRTGGLHHRAPTAVPVLFG